MTNLPFPHRGKSFDASMFLKQNIAYDASGNAEYIGYAVPGTGDGDAGWLITKYTYDGSNQMTGSGFADASYDFNKAWASRTGYSYS